MFSSSSFITARPFERAMWLWGRDALVLGQLPTPRSRKFLDVGAGAGLLSLTAASLGFDVTAIDLSASEIGRLDATIAAAPSTSPAAAIETIVGDGQTLEGIADASVDVVASAFGIFMFPDRAAAWTSALRVLTPGGRLVATSWDAAGLNVRLFQYLVRNAVDREAPTPQDPPKAPNRSMQPASFRQELEECGFTDVRVHTLSHPIAFTSGRELVKDLLASAWVQSVVGHKHTASLMRSVLDFAQLELDGHDPLGADAAQLLCVDAAVPAEEHPLWTAPFALQALGHIAVATKM